MHFVNMLGRMRSRVASLRLKRRAEYAAPSGGWETEFAYRILTRTNQY
jgi:hypothetical protein